MFFKFLLYNVGLIVTYEEVNQNMKKIIYLKNLDTTLASSVLVAMVSAHLVTYSTATSMYLFPNVEGYGIWKSTPHT